MAEGIEGLVVALDKFDNSKGVKLSTYAAWWIRQRIQKYLSKFSNPVAIPHDVAQQKRREYLIRNELQLQLGRDPTEEELFAHMLRDKKMIARSKHAPNSSSSLDEPMGSSELTLAELLPESESTEKSYREKGSLSDDLKIALDFLDKREKKIIIWRFGINGKDRMILSEIARELGVTAERVRQIEDRAIRKLRALLLNKGKIDFQRLDELAKLKLSHKTSMSPLQLLLLGEQAA
jgi:RNA polymerase primary sigma factor